MGTTHAMSGSLSWSTCLLTLLSASTQLLSTPSLLRRLSTPPPPNCPFTLTAPHLRRCPTDTGAHARRDRRPVAELTASKGRGRGARRCEKAGRNEERERVGEDGRCSAGMMGAETRRMQQRARGMLSLRCADLECLCAPNKGKGECILQSKRNKWRSGNIRSTV